MRLQPTNFRPQRRNMLLVATLVRRAAHALPFETDEQNASYGNLATLCAEHGLDLWVTHHESFAAEGKRSGGSDGETISRAWVWQDRSSQGGMWQPAPIALSDVSLCYADLPQNSPEANRFRRALEAREIRTVNALALSDLLTDKLATHDLFETHTPRTLSVADPELVDRLRGLDLHPDLSIERLVLKPRYGERGRGIYITDLDDLATHPALRFEDYIVQAFLETGSGIPELGIEERHDLRLIVRDGEIALAFVRLPASGSFVSNCSQGGREITMGVEDLPEHIASFAAGVDDGLRHFGPRVYSLDLGVGSSGKIWIYELNTMPGIVWDDALPQNKPLHRNMHRLLASWLRETLPQASPRISTSIRPSSVPRVLPAPSAAPSSPAPSRHIFIR